MTKFKMTLLAASAIALSATTIPALAAGSDNFMSKADLNADQVITLDELNQAARTQFNTSDTNADGFLSEDERETARTAQTAERASNAFDAKDTNGDGVLSKDEVTSQLTERGDKDRAERSNRGEDGQRSRGGNRDDIRAKVDTNGDGEISDDERAAAKEAFRANRGERSNGADKQDSNQEGRQNKGEHSQRASLDSNDDGLISLAEVDAATQAKFTKADANNDGSLSADELKRGGSDGSKGRKSRG